MKKLKGKRAAVLGFGIEGRDLVEYLLKEGARVTIFDQKERNKIDLSGINKKVKLICGKYYLSKGIKDFDFVFRSPGVYRYKTELVKAEKNNIQISSAVKLFFDLCPANIIGITGTKGKGTTSTLIYNILKNSGKDVYLAGNIGKPYLSLLPKLKKTSWVVLELSSFQLIDLTKSPHVGVVLNVTEDHLDWHKSKNEYIDAKKNIFKFQNKSDFAVINCDYELPLTFGRLTCGKKFFFSKEKKVKGCYVESGEIILSVNKKRHTIAKTNELLLRGKHNWENICAAVCASWAAKSDLDSIKKEVKSFKGLEHRLELVGKIKNITFYNDSFATGPQPTMAAVLSFPEPLTLILGGYDKGMDYSPFIKEISDIGNIENIILVGDIRNKLKKHLKKYSFKGKIIDLGYSKMEKIVKVAINETKREGVVLLSPAAASFDMFDNYKERGNQFKKEVIKYGK